MKQFFEFALIFVLVLLTLQFITELSNTGNNVDNFIISNNTNNTTIPPIVDDGDNEVQEYVDNSCTTFRAENSDYCTRIGLNPTNATPLLITVSKNYTEFAYARIEFRGGCFGFAESSSIIPMEQNVLDSNPLRDRTINRIELFHPTGFYFEVKIKKTLTQIGIPYCVFRSFDLEGTSIQGVNKSYFYVYKDDQSIELTMKE